MIGVLWVVFMNGIPLAVAQDSSDEPFILGADVSFYEQLDEAGAVYSDNGVDGDLLEILKDHGVNTIRLRLWHTPEEPWNSLEQTLIAAQKVHAAGFDLLLDFHYSDTWADPGKQIKPAAWAGAPFEILTDSVRAYTRTVLNRFKLQGTTPAYVQIGNEISVGMLWDDGKVGGSFDTPAQWSKLATLLNAAIESVHEVFSDDEVPGIILHTDHGGNLAAASWFFGHIQDEGVPYDIIGLSYYPFWHGSLSDLQRTLSGVVDRFDKPVLLLETAYPWTLGWFDNVNNIIGLPEHVLPGYEATPQGQYSFLKDVIESVEEVASGKGLGLVYWAPEYMAVPGVGSPWENMTLFDENGAALPGLEAFKEASVAVNVGVVDNPIPVEHTLSFYPTPFAEYLYMEAEVALPTAMELRLYSILGAEVASHSILLHPGKQTVELNFPDNPPGLYMYRGYVGDRFVSGTLVKTR